jgi:hypothetical protein
MAHSSFRLTSEHRALDDEDQIGTCAQSARCPRKRRNLERRDREGVEGIAERWQITEEIANGPRRVLMMLNRWERLADPF